MFGQPPDRIEPRRQTGVMMQEAALAPELRVREQIDLVASYYPDPMTPDEALEITGAAPLRNRPYGKLSTGQKRLVQFAIAIAGRPRLLFLDEPTVGLDIQNREMVWATLRRLLNDGASIVLTTHYLEEAEALADRVAVLAKGQLIATGTVSHIRGLVVRKRITCRTTLAADQVATWPDVQTVTSDQHGLHITASNTENVVRRLLAADDDLQDLEVQRAGLGGSLHRTHSGDHSMNPALAQTKTSDVVSSPAMPLSRLLRAYAIEAKYESLRMLRAPAFAGPFLALPAGSLPAVRSAAIRRGYRQGPQSRRSSSSWVSPFLA